MPVFNDWYEQEYRSAGVDVLGVSQFSTSREETLDFVQAKGLSFANVYDETAQLATAFQVEGVPSYVFLDSDGRLAGKSHGANGMQPLEDILTPLLVDTSPR